MRSHRVCSATRGKTRRSERPHWAGGVPSFIPDWWKNGAPGKTKMRTFRDGRFALKTISNEQLSRHLRYSGVHGLNRLRRILRPERLSRIVMYPKGILASARQEQTTRPHSCDASLPGSDARIFRGFFLVQGQQPLCNLHKVGKGLELPRSLFNLLQVGLPVGCVVDIFKAHGHTLDIVGGAKRPT